MGKYMVIPNDWKLPKEIVARFGEKAGRQRIMRHDDHILLVLHEVPEASTSVRKGVLFWNNPGGEWLSSGKGEGLSSLKIHIKSYDSCVDELDQRFDSANSAKDLFDILSSVIPIHRASKNMHKVIQDLRETFRGDKDIISLRDQAYEIERTSELLMNDAKNAIDYDIAKRAEEQTKQNEEISLSAHRLNMLAAIFFPITAIASILSTNLHTGLETWTSPVLFWVIMALSLMLGFILRDTLGRTKGNVGKQERT